MEKLINLLIILAILYIFYYISIETVKETFLSSFKIDENENTKTEECTNFDDDGANLCDVINYETVEPSNNTIRINENINTVNQDNDILMGLDNSATTFASANNGIENTVTTFAPIDYQNTTNAESTIMTRNINYANDLELPGKNNNIGDRMLGSANDQDEFHSAEKVDELGEGYPNSAVQKYNQLQCGINMGPEYKTESTCNNTNNHDWKLHKPIDPKINRIKNCEDPNLPPTIKDLYDRSVKDFKKINSENMGDKILKTQNNYTMDSDATDKFSFINRSAPDNSKTTESIFAYDQHFDNFSIIN